MDWPRISVRVREADVARLPDLLASYSAREIHLMQAALIEARRLLDIDPPPLPPPSTGSAGGAPSWRVRDGFDMVAHHLHQIASLPDPYGRDARHQLAPRERRQLSLVIFLGASASGKSTAGSHLARAIERTGAARALFVEMDAFLPSSANYFAAARADLPLGLASTFSRAARRLRVPIAGLPPSQLFLTGPEAKLARSFQRVAMRELLTALVRRVPERHVVARAVVGAPPVHGSFIPS